MEEKTKEKISKALKGRKQSQETIKKRFESRKGYKHSEETKKKISIANNKKVLIKCANCNKEKYISPFYNKRSKNNFCNHKCHGEWLKKNINGKKSHFWREGKYKSSDGYILEHNPNHPNCDGDGYVRQHRLRVEAFIKRFLTKEETVHHIDGNKQNNSLSNLMIFPNQSEHLKFHIYFDKYGFNQRVRIMIKERWQGYKINPLQVKHNI